MPLMLIICYLAKKILLRFKNNNKNNNSNNNIIKININNNNFFLALGIGDALGTKK